MNPNHYLAVAIRYLLTHRPQLAARRRCRQDAGQQQHDRPGRAKARPPALRSAGRIQVVRRRDCSMARAASAARRAPEPASCGRTAPSGRPTRTARSWTCWRRKSPPGTGKDPGEHYRELTAEFGTPYYTRSTRRHARARRRGCGNAVARRRQGVDTRRRADHRQS